jgi:hypothetical protein
MVENWRALIGQQYRFSTAHIRHVPAAQGVANLSERLAIPVENQTLEPELDTLR